MSDDIYTYWSSKTAYSVECWVDPEKTIPYPMTGLEPIVIGKKRKTDTDANAIFILSIGNGLEIDTENSNILNMSLASADTSSLPRTQTTVVYCELLITSPERQTLNRFEIPVRDSIKELDGS